MSTESTTRAPLDRNDVRVATRAVDALAAFNLAGVIGPAEVHGARTLAQTVGDDRREVLLAAALALRAPQHGHVCVDLGDVAATVAVAEDSPVAVDELEWPPAEQWRAVLTDSRLVRVRPEGTPDVDDLQPEHDRPLVLVGERLYLDRYWRYERRVAAALQKRAGRVDEDVDLPRVRQVLDRLLPPGDERPDRQRLAVAMACRRDLTVIAGGPGTGKTHTVARLLALLHELADPDWPRVAVAAPTGKAADRLTAALRAAVEDPTLDVSPAVRERLRALEGSTLHRLLRRHPGNPTRFRHDRSHKLPHEIVIVDETSMVDLPLMAKLIQALRPRAKLVLVGDPDQLASVEAGAVLADIVGTAGNELRMSEDDRAALEAATGEPLGASTTDDPAVVAPARVGGIDDAVVVLGTVRRFGAESGIARLAAAIHAGDGEDVLDVLRAGAADVTWIEAAGDAGDRRELSAIRERVVAAGRGVFSAARQGDAVGALAALDRLRVLTAHRRGQVGVTGWVPLVERWLSREVDGFDATGRFYVGRPVMITRNDPRLRLYNGDVGVVVRPKAPQAPKPNATGDTVQVAFPGSGGVRLFAPSRLEDLETVHAMTIHKSQGSQFDQVIVVLPEESSQILTRELLYTAVTRAQRGVTLVGGAGSVRAAIARRVARASGLRSTLWPSTSEGSGPSPDGPT